MSDKSPEEIRALLAGPPWGFLLSDGTFVEVPKIPLISGGFTLTPFEVTLPGGQTRYIIEKPADELRSDSQPGGV